MAEKRDIKKDFLWRIYLMYALIAVFGFAVLLKVFTIQFAEGEHWRKKEQELTMKYIDIEASRGNIYSSDGSLIATSVPIFELRMDVVSEPVTDKIFYEQVDSLSYCLSKTFKHKTYNDWRTDLKNARKRKNRYYLIARKVEYATLKKVRRFPIFRLGKYKGGLIVLQKSRRELPFKKLAQRTIGYDRNSKKPLGIEGAFNKDLQGVSGKRLVQKIAGDIYKPINQDNEIEPKDGNDIITTIDANIQDVAHHALEKQLKAQNAHHGCAVLMEVKTGAIKAMVNLSRVDTGDYVETFNYAIGEGTEPGSTFKLVSLMAAFEDGYTDLDEVVNIEGGRKAYAGGYIMRDSHEGDYGQYTVKQVFEKSSNVGTSNIIMKYYKKQPQKFIDRVYSFGLHQPLGIALPGEAKPYIKDTKSKLWSALSLPLMSIGYEEKLTPLQTLNFYNTVANNGKMMRPQFVQEIRSKGKLIKSFAPEVINPAICSQATIDKAKAMMEGVVREGTATNLRTAPYQIAAKTGTAQIAIGNKGYSIDGKKSYMASLCGYFPAKDPLYSIIIVVYAPSKAAYYGNEVAGPVFREIADKVYSNSMVIIKPLQKDTSRFVMHVPAVKGGKKLDIDRVAKELSLKTAIDDVEANYVWAQPDNKIIRMKVNPTKELEVPQLVGMGLRDALSILENQKLLVKVVGRGVIRKQSLIPGTKVVKGSTITIELS
ncbi:MAG: penicillin-binding transpeptidase domain-containing protein [Bacteroidota bacterium]|jgi:cell division protein FtsI (penicillin-binding protein 3)